MLYTAHLDFGFILNYTDTTMLDIKFIKENKEVVEAACKNKNKEVDVSALIDFYEKRISLRQQIDDINQKRNIAQKERNIEEGQRLKASLESIETEFKDLDKKYMALMLALPNIPSLDTPLGKDENDNKVIRQWGTKPQFSFTPREHFEIGADLGVIDTETATEVAGPRLAYLKGDLALLQFAVLQFCFESLTSKEVVQKIKDQAKITIDVAPFIPVIPPVFIKPAVQNRMARFLTPQDHYLFPEDDLMLIGSAEHTLGSMHMDEVFEEKDLPIRYVGYSTAFRREAGSYG